MSPLASASLLTGLARAGERARRGRPARPHRAVRATSGATLAAGRGAGQLGPDRGALRRMTRTAGRSGHDGVILHTRDGGDSWTRQLDGRAPTSGWSQHMQARVAAIRPGVEAAARRSQALRGAGRRQAVPRRLVRRREERLSSSAPSACLAHRATAARPGSRWFDRDRQPEGAAPLRGPRASAARLYIAGEQGLLLKLDRDGAALPRARRCPTRAACSASSATAAAWSCFGLRGNVFRSADGGADLAAGADAGLPVGDRRRRGRRATARFVLVDARPARRCQRRRRRELQAPFPLEAADAARGGRGRRQRPARARRPARRRQTSSQP